ncbi:hypothetical protein ACIPEL_36370 [Streptomyces griseoviridis]
MRVVADEAFRFFYNHVPISVTEGEIIESDVAVFLLNTAAAVRPDDEDSRTLAEELGLTATDAIDVSDGSDGSRPSAPDADADGLDIDAPVKAVLAWAGTDPDRATQALELERAKAEPRSTLVAQLEKAATAGT